MVSHKLNTCSSVQQVSMVQKKFNLIVAACENLGIGIQGNLPWRLKNELKYFNKMTTSTVDQNKRNAVIMGRRTYFGIPPNKRPLPNRLNVVLSNNSTASDYPADVVLCKSLSQAINQLSETDLGADIESIWICGGYSVYKEAMTLDECHRVYFTEIKAKFDCDAFFPDIPSTFTIVPNDDDIPSEEQEENGLKYQYKIYEKVDQ